jgi:flagellar protein FlhE
MRIANWLFIGLGLTMFTGLIVAAGSWSATNVPLPWILNSGTWYSSSDMAAPAGITGTIGTNVGWRWAQSAPVPSNQVWLCINSGTSCLDITSMATGSTNAFNGKNAATTVFRFYVRANTSTPLPGGVHGGGTGNLVVNYQ